MKESLTPSIQDYLEAILEISEQEKSVRVTDIAQKLNIAKASVNQAVKTLTELGLVDHIKYGPVILTAKGRKEAQKVYYRHQIIKIFLTKVLQVDLLTAEIDACGMEHAVSFLTMEALITFLEAGGFIEEGLDISEAKRLLKEE